MRPLVAFSLVSLATLVGSGCDIVEGSLPPVDLDGTWEAPQQEWSNSLSGETVSMSISLALRTEFSESQFREVNGLASVSRDGESIGAMNVQGLQNGRAFTTLTLTANDGQAYYSFRCQHEGADVMQCEDGLREDDTTNESTFTRTD